MIQWSVRHNYAMRELDPNILAYYGSGNEAHRLLGGFPSGPLELERTKEIINRYLLPPPLKIIDVGGGPGVYAAWLADRDYHVHLVDPVPLHVDQARSAHSGISVEIGDARRLSQADASADIVLLLGPLYHLVERTDRLRTLSEAHRVLRPGGLAFVAAISRYAALFDLLVRLGRLHEPEVFGIVSEAVETGVFRGQVSRLFTTAYFHLPQELAQEVAEVGFELSALLNVEGPGFLLNDFAGSWADPHKRKAILDAARLVESKAEMLAVSSHILAVARKQ
jgi:ubiquinone/menaquinone biosynthesis C-methylase UbiE